MCRSNSLSKGKSQVIDNEILQENAALSAKNQCVDSKILQENVATSYEPLLSATHMCVFVPAPTKFLMLGPSH